METSPENDWARLPALLSRIQADLPRRPSAASQRRNLRQLAEDARLGRMVRELRAARQIGERYLALPPERRTMSDAAARVAAGMANEVRRPPGAPKKRYDMAAAETDYIVGILMEQGMSRAAACRELAKRRIPRKSGMRESRWLSEVENEAKRIASDIDNRKRRGMHRAPFGLHLFFFNPEQLDEIRKMLN